MEVLDRARAYAAAVPGAISGSRGHDQTFALANALTWGFALDDAAALLLLQEWNAGCQPPWKDRDLRHKISQSRRASHQKPFGYLLAAGERPQTFRQPQVAPPAEMVTWKIKRRPVEKSYAAYEETGSIEPNPSSEGVSFEMMPLADDGLVAVPGCRVKRPVEIEMADADWQKLDAAGWAGEPLVQLAAWMFGPCTVLETGRAAA